MHENYESLFQLFGPKTEIKIIVENVSKIWSSRRLVCGFKIDVPENGKLRPLEMCT
jgi:hypothetical protein